MSKDIITGFRNFQYCLKGSGSNTPAALSGAMKISFKPQSASRSAVMRYENGGVAERTEVRGTGSTASLAIVSLPDSFLKDVLGYVKDNDGILIEGEHTSAHFYLLYETQGLTEPTRHILMDCVCSKPSFDVSTMSSNANIDTRSLEIVMNPVIDNQTVVYRKSVKRSENSTAFDNWFGLITSG